MTETGYVGREHRNVGFGEALRLGFSNYALFRGRSSRGAFWFWVLGTAIVSVILSGIDYALFGSSQPGFLGGIWSLAILVPNIAVAARRLHDVNHSGWWLLLVLTGIGILLLLFWYVQPGQAQTNDFGPDVEAGKG
ncbi:DUF805 domain-containing protein [Martelella sp. AD-3]|uniref:DUF805 domain-containing protein n=1 Tax=Martelella sp. AD-3 TaxID=686597 RepID=UPI000686B920|nr:DUF805 domain-containing protein [Martelella sp. AD-3]AMM83523.1 hypothetical protein AZF01_03420 [Martelella sp. AD-3]MAM12043.1 DUF805 domain-containing protein [Rhizobiaceae bacterium]|tara:strand:+ start:1214 stop:1621 length:408 start_codon:yes stop_codon:yes gene_type:complete